MGPPLSRPSQLLWLRLELLTSLEVQLTSCSCVTGHECPDVQAYESHIRCESCHLGCKRGKGKPFSLNEVDTKAELSLWHTFCTALKNGCTSSFQRLTVICDCVDVTTALQVVLPLQGFRTIENATIRLGQLYNSDLKKIAEQTVQQLTGQPINPVFTFDKLPLEIQEMILSYANPAAPEHISWRDDSLTNFPNSNGGRYNEIQWFNRRSTFPGFSLLKDKGCNCCLQCTQSREVCACPTSNAAYSSRSCNC